METLDISKPKKGAKGSKRHKMIRSAKNIRTGKYVRQAARTEANKQANVARRVARWPKYRGVGRDKQGRKVVA